MSYRFARRILAALRRVFVPSSRPRLAARWTSVDRLFALRRQIEELEARTVPATITFANAAGGDWNTAANWVGGVTPTSADDAVIPDFTGTPTITFSGDTSVHSVVSAERIFFDGGRNWTIGTTSSLNAGIDLSAGSNVFISSGTLTIGGASSWADGTFGGAGSVLQTGTLSLVAGNHNVATTFNNLGTISQSGGKLGIGVAAGAFVNLSGGVHNITVNTADFTIIDAANGGSYTNQGTLQRTSGTANLIVNGSVSNQGTVSTQTGSLDFRATGTQSGTFATSSGATTYLRGAGV